MTYGCYNIVRKTCEILTDFGHASTNLGSIELKILSIVILTPYLSTSCIEKHFIPQDAMKALHKTYMQSNLSFRLIPKSL